MGAAGTLVGWLGWDRQEHRERVREGRRGKRRGEALLLVNDASPKTKGSCLLPCAPHPVSFVVLRTCGK